MSRRTITTREELDRLAARTTLALASATGPEDPVAPPEGMDRPGQAPLGPARSVWTIPPPSQGATYTARDVAALAGVAEATVRGWIARGVRVGGQCVRLASLRAPRGRIAPSALCEFLALANGCDVVLGR